MLKGDAALRGAEGRWKGRRYYARREANERMVEDSGSCENVVGTARSYIPRGMTDETRRPAYARHSLAFKPRSSSPCMGRLDTLTNI